ncbi:MaoC family dehydratase N-terminal domain-containing protein [Streptomyces sp. NBC_00243]|uniref:FAS1-like dehydratase domain-containing protein n=1 Tax=Streptomyces sp. NBC_00243 TaxID=2975688 RepID=UPI002DD8F6AA|nr:MaoC family dehydratase N-terminal domain-containing protein [Streptomyces sp. NBC_00243]WRZ25381.1 MaoC family dehydratase N-terminal domain-containing protein [Streptomyces sp. NBC_00243]
MSTLLQAHCERLKAEVGTERTERLGTIRHGDIARFAVASHAPPPRPGPGDATAPPLFLSSVMGWGDGPAESELDADGTAASDTRGIPLGGVRLMGAGQDLEFHNPVRAGVSVVVHTSLDDVQLKHGRSGSLLLLRIRRRFTDEAGTPLVTCRESFIAR